LARPLDSDPGFLTLISAFNYLDRSILALALPAIKAEMHLSDTVLGLVYGSAFAIFYAIFGVPVAWLADTGNRTRIIAVGFAFWSLMTALTGQVVSVWQLAASRFLMGCGEACCVPPAHSIIADLFGRSSRASAMALFGTAYSVAYAVFFPLAGWVIGGYGWRIMFVVAVCRVSWSQPCSCSAYESRPRRSGRRPREAPTLSLPASLRLLTGSSAYRWILVGSALMARMPTRPAPGSRPFCRGCTA